MRFVLQRNDVVVGSRVDFVNAGRIAFAL